jgi:chemotaxis protein histidine kinase CheA
LIQVLCREGVTTRLQATETSGRGIGMAAVQHCVEQLEGHIEVRSSKQGTTWLFHFPLRARFGSGSQFPELTLSSQSQVGRLATS